MSVADRIGLFPGFNRVADHGLLVTSLICVAMPLLIMIVIALVLEGRMLPLWEHQFKSFFPGVVYLGVAMTCLLMGARSLPSEHHWYNSFLWHIVVIDIATIIAIVLAKAEYESGIYPRRAIFSPTKIYFSIFILSYIYIAVTTCVAVVVVASQDWWKWLTSAVLMAGLSVFLIIRDKTMSRDDVLEVAHHAHVADWHPCWTRHT